MNALSCDHCIIVIMRKAVLECVCEHADSYVHTYFNGMHDLIKVYQ